mmetsp:Transcript_39111/g.44601  ORF Transcript_39111/g.44601 Transcript_39111/m.44601 type:complete len:256 (+) Transcript_39111:129-896(+)|eukprot:CAMPEP_0194141130 /NCGR_PEP_ID=MMETSP0152-20130528/10615_1 /TAXON_ID=1049557 /ORGANISM="Thalassiothrix antarctica, Strain L6-D1" /LENGTH=255 /DNA_ID=CAMNT_0038839669 /DNA_START=87 /DNA_END=854 /DNA_ORIENTATION=-
MTVLGVPDGNGFTIGTSSSIAAPSGGGTSMDVSLDDMILSRRNRPARNAKTSTVDRSMARGRASRQAATMARRGLSDNKRPSQMEVRREVSRQARRPTTERKPPGPGRRAKPSGVVKAKEKQDIKRKQDARKRSSSREDNVIPPAWIGGTRRPPSKKAVTAAVEAMTDAGFKVPRGMQMVISFAPAPNSDPTKDDSRRSSNRDRGDRDRDRGGRDRGDRDRGDRDRGGRGRGRGRGGGRGGRRGGGRGGGRGGRR